MRQPRPQIHAERAFSRWKGKAFSCTLVNLRVSLRRRCLPSVIRSLTDISLVAFSPSSIVVSKVFLFIFLFSGVDTLISPGNRRRSRSTSWLRSEERPGLPRPLRTAKAARRH